MKTFFSFLDKNYVGVGVKLLRGGRRKDNFFSKKNRPMNYSTIEKEFSIFFAGAIMQHNAESEIRMACK